MASIDSYRMRPHEELSDHLADIDARCKDVWELYQALCAERLMVSSVIAEKTGGLALEHEARLETIQSEPPILSIVAA